MRHKLMANSIFSLIFADDVAFQKLLNEAGEKFLQANKQQLIDLCCEKINLRVSCFCVSSSDLYDDHRRVSREYNKL